MTQSLRDLRLNKGLFQQALAEAIGVSVATVSRWELGEGSPEAPTILKLAEFFGIEPAELRASIAESQQQAASAARAEKVAAEAAD